jgi:hypothetical protein
VGNRADAADTLCDMGCIEGVVIEQNILESANIVPELLASMTCWTPSTVSTITSIFKCPSMRVTGSILMVVAICIFLE